VRESWWEARRVKVSDDDDEGQLQGGLISDDEGKLLH
jgi:hypothetical protein